MELMIIFIKRLHIFRVIKINKKKSFKKYFSTKLEIISDRLNYEVSFFAFKHRYRFKDLNNFLHSRVYGKYFLLNLGGPFKHFIAKILFKINLGFAISCDSRQL